MKKLIQIILLLALFNNSYSQSLISDFNYNVSYHKCFTANAEFCFDQSSTEDTDSVFWDFGDGIKIKVLHSNCASHRYTKRGSFAVKLTIWKNGIKNEIIKPDLIIINNPPSVSIDLDVKNIDSLYAPTSIKFRSYTKKGDGDSLKYSWTFQNNISTNDTCATFQFDHPDTYTISLNVTDNLGCSVTVSDYIIVKDSAIVVSINTL